jgi:hypothetical protein
MAKLYGISNSHPFSSVKSQTKRLRHTRDDEEFKYAKHNDRQEVNDNSGCDILSCARMGCAEQGRRVAGLEARSWFGEILSNAGDTPYAGDSGYAKNPVHAKDTTHGENTMHGEDTAKEWSR